MLAHPQDGVRRECVMVSMLPEGHHNVIAEAVTGTSRKEIADDGTAVVAAQQQKRKYDALVSEVVAPLKACLANAKAEGEAFVAEVQIDL